MAVGGMAGIGERTYQVLSVQFARDRLAKCRWKIEQDYQQLKEELGLDHYEGRSWIGWHHHTTLVMMAHAFLTLETLRRKKNFWLDPATDAS
jgi:SRSO17 transposase